MKNYFVSTSSRRPRTTADDDDDDDDDTCLSLVRPTGTCVDGNSTSTEPPRTGTKTPATPTFQSLVTFFSFSLIRLVEFSSRTHRRVHIETYVSRDNPRNRSFAGTRQEKSVILYTYHNRPVDRSLRNTCGRTCCTS